MHGAGYRTKNKSRFGYEGQKEEESLVIAMKDDHSMLGYNNAKMNLPVRTEQDGTMKEGSLGISS